MRGRRVLAWAGGLVLAFGVAAAGLWLAQGVWLRAAVERMQAASDGALRVEGLEAARLDGLGAAAVHWRGDGVAVRGEGVRLRWNPLALLGGQLRVLRLEAQTIEIEATASTAPLAWPASLAPPLPLHIDALVVRRLVLRSAPGASAWTLDDVQAALRHGDGVWTLERLALGTIAVPSLGPWTAQALRLRGRVGDAPPFATTLEGEVRVAAPTLAPLLGAPRRVHLRGDGSLEALRLQAATGWADGGVAAVAQLQPFAPQPLQRLALALRGGSPPLPPTATGRAREVRLDADALIVPAADGSVAIEAAVSNAVAGPLDAGRLPLARLQFAGRLEPRGGVLRIERAVATPSADGAGRIELSGRLGLGDGEPGRPALWPQAVRFEAQAIDLRSLHRAAGATALQARGSLDGARWSLRLRDALVRDAARARAVPALDASGSLTQVAGSWRVEVDAARAVLGAAAAAQAPLGATAAERIDLRGRLALAAPWAGQLEATLTGVTPARWLAALAPLGGAPGAALGAALHRLEAIEEVTAWLRADGDLAAQALEFRLTASRAAGRPAVAQGRARLEAPSAVVSSPIAPALGVATPWPRLAALWLDARWGEAQVQARGALGAADDRMSVRVTLPRLAALRPAWAGQAQVEATLRGPWAGLALEGRVGASGLAFGPDLRLALAEARFAGGLVGDAPLDGVLEARGVIAGAVRFDALRAALSGTAAAHRVSLRAQGDAASASLSASGVLEQGAGRGAPETRWRGTLEEAFADLRADPTLPPSQAVQVRDAPAVRLRLGAPWPLQVSARRFEAGPASWTVDEARVEFARLDWRADDGAGAARIDTAGRVTGLDPLRIARLFAPRLQVPALAAARLTARWAVTGAWPEALDGTLEAVLREPADDAVLAEVRARLDRSRWSGPARLTLPSLARWEPVLGPEWALDGRLRVEGVVSGPLHVPRIAGEVRGEALRLEQRALGWRFGDGTLEASFDGERLQLRALRLASGAGQVVLSGEARWPAQSAAWSEARGRFRLRAERLLIPIGPGQRIVLSGDTELLSQGLEATWRGPLRVEEGLIELRGGDAPALPEDVVVIDRRVAPRPEPTPAVPGAPQLALAAELDLDLGDRLRVRGSGVDAMLAGRLSLRGRVPEAPRATGLVEVRRGTYSAYGQALAIETGQVRFNGPLDNPVLDFVAMRRNLPVEAGVQITGTVLAPRVRLVSRPELPDAEKLSWLVLGTGLEGARDGAQGAALQAAAATLFGRNDGALSGGIARALGLDVLSLRSAAPGAGLAGAAGLGSGFTAAGATLPGQVGSGTLGAVAAGSAPASVVAIGKRLNSRVLVTYEQGLRGVWNLVRLQYDVGQRLSVRASAGTETALDLLYFWSFDRPAR